MQRLDGWMLRKINDGMWLGDDKLMVQEIAVWSEIPSLFLYPILFALQSNYNHPQCLPLSPLKMEECVYQCREKRGAIQCVV